MKARIPLILAGVFGLASFSVAQDTEVASLVAYLCSEEAGYITGQVFSVDGGMAM